VNNINIMLLETHDITKMTLKTLFLFYSDTHNFWTGVVLSLSISCQGTKWVTSHQALNTQSTIKIVRHHTWRWYWRLLYFCMV